MDISIGFVPVHDFEVRGRTPSTEKNFSRDLSMSFTWSFVIYHERMANNGMDVDQEPVDNSPALSYEEEHKKILCLSKMTETLGNTRPLDGNNKANNTNPQHACNVNQNEQFQRDVALNNNNDNVINIQLLYDLNTPMELELWSGNFYLISLHSLWNKSLQTLRVSKTCLISWQDTSTTKRLTLQRQMTYWTLTVLETPSVILSLLYTQLTGMCSIQITNPLLLEQKLHPNSCLGLLQTITRATRKQLRLSW